MILQILAIVLIVIVLLVAAVLLIPFRVVLNASASLTTRNADIAISWLGLTLWRSKPTKPKEPKKAEGEKKRGERSDVGRLFRMVSLVRESIPAITIIARSIKRATHVRRLTMDFKFGFDDPADTAEFAGYLWSFAWILNIVPSVNLSIRPEFGAISLDGSVKADARVRMLYIVFGFLRAYTKRPFRRLVKEARARR
jgi:Protein of unknown function (DUF2953)